MRLKLNLACVLASILLAPAAQAAAVYQFNIDTRSLSGSQGYFEVQLGNSGFGVFQEATATISNFQSPGGALANIDPYSSFDLYGSADVFGTASGILPGTLVLDDNGTATVTDYLQPITFGSSISFLVTLGGPAIDASLCAGAASGGCSARDFGIGILDATENYRLVADPLGTEFLVGGLDISSNGTVTTYSNPAPNGGVSALSVSTPVPEPAPWTLFMVGLVAIAAWFGRGSLRRKGRVFC